MTKKIKLNKDFYQTILDTTKEKRRKIGIEINKVTSKVIASLRKAEEYVDVVVVGKKIEGFECVESDSIGPLIQIAKDKKFDAIVRGNFDALDAYNAVHKILGIKESIFKYSIIPKSCFWDSW